MANLEEEKKLVSHLRNEKGMTLQDIAHKLNKSIYWVKSRLDNKYEPKRQRRTKYSDHFSDENNEVTDPKLSAEIDVVKKLRDEGLTFEQIASKLNRSIYWVHTRLRKKYTPRVSLNEKNFQESRVIPFLIKNGHKIIGQYVRTEAGHFIQEADILSIYNGKIFITEVKVSIIHHQFQTALGQLILHKYSFNNEKNLCLQIALPSETRSKVFTEDFLNYFKSIYNIEIIFIP